MTVIEVELRIKCLTFKSYVCYAYCMFKTRSLYIVLPFTTSMQQRLFTACTQTNIISCTLFSSLLQLMSLNKTGSSRNLRPNKRVGKDESNGRRDLILSKKEKKSYG